MSRKVATLIGLSAILMWSVMAGLVKKISGLFGADFGITLVYTCSALVVLLVFKIPNLKLIPKAYLLWGTVLFVVYELAFSFAIAYAENNQQAIEVNMIHYLWPSLTIMMFIIYQELKFNFWVIIGLCISVVGIAYTQAGADGFQLSVIFHNMLTNPKSYGLALLAAFIWSLYCVVTKKLSQGQNPIAIFFIFVAAMMWMKLLSSGHFILPSVVMVDYLWVIMAACAVGLGYAAWNIGIIRGNITILVAASYFSPILSSLSAMLILQAELSVSFWKGTALVILGSLICWVSTNWSHFKPTIKCLIKH